MAGAFIACFILGCLIGLAKLYNIHNGKAPGITESKSLLKYFLG